MRIPKASAQDSARRMDLSRNLGIFAEERHNSVWHHSVNLPTGISTKRKNMKLVRYGRPGHEKPGMIDAEGKLRDLSAIIDDISPAALSDKALAKLAKVKPAKLPAVRGKPRYGVPVAGITAPSSASMSKVM